jgi:predicted nucleic acid-binding protein
VSDIYLVDTNIWIAHSISYPDAVSYMDDQLIAKGKTIAINTVIMMELMSHEDVENHQSVRDVFEDYIYNMADEIYEIGDEIAMKAAEIRRKAKVAGRKVPKGPDALIAATASLLQIPVVSNNDKDFIWASQHPDFCFTYINPIQDNEAYKRFQDALIEAKKEN